MGDIVNRPLTLLNGNVKKFILKWFYVTRLKNGATSLRVSDTRCSVNLVLDINGVLFKLNYTLNDWLLLFYIMY